MTSSIARSKRKVTTTLERETSLRVLGVIVNDKLTAVDHVAMLMSSSSRMLYAMRVLRAHGTPATPLHDILCSWHNNVFLIFLILICF